MVGRGRFQADRRRIDVEHARQAGADRLTVRREPGYLGEQRDVHVLDGPFGASAVVGHLAKQIQAAGVFVFRVVIRKERADVTDARRATERVDQRVADHVSVAMPLQPHIPGQFDAAKHQPAAHHQPVEIEAAAYTHIGSAASRASTINASARVVTLRLL